MINNQESCYNLIRMISIIVATRDRQDKLLQCVKAFLKNTPVNYELIILDQSNDRNFKSLTFINSRIKHYHLSFMGKSRALNTGIRIASGEILAFTDDDCLVTPKWITKILTFMEKNPDIHAVFGSVYPHIKTKTPDTICPSTLTLKRSRYIKREGAHVSQIGYGNNMAIRKNALISIGGFRTWLGPGTIVPTAEDAEISIRLLMYGYQLAYEPAISVCHNRWLSPSAMRKQDASYFRAEAACYMYYAFQGRSFAQRILKRQLTQLAHRMFISWMNLSRHRLTRHTLGTVYWQTQLFCTACIGTVIGSYFALVDPLPKMNHKTLL